MTADVAEFLAARLDEDESRTGANWIGLHLHELRFRVKEEISTDPEPGLEWLAAYGQLYETEIENIADAYWARVHREVEVKRKIIAEYQALDYDTHHMLGPYPETHGRWHSLRFAVRLLAAVYSDHPDYNPAWA